jgi:deferrochelatase/peroxidase EfeB
VNVAFTKDGLDLLRHPIDDVPFEAGLAARSVPRSLVGDPADWTICRPDERIDVLINIGSAEANRIEPTVAEVRERLGAAYAVVHEVTGELLNGGHEHFGFRDGLTQPFATDRPEDALAAMKPADRPLTERTATTQAADEPAAVWPHWAAPVLQTAADKAAQEATASAEKAEAAEKALADLPPNPRKGSAAANRYALLSVEAEHARALADQAGLDAAEARRKAEQRIRVRRAGQPMVPVDQFVLRSEDKLIHNGSFLVWLKLEQEPAAFAAMCSQLAERLIAAGHQDIDEQETAAMLVGRRADGTPLAAASSADPEDFSYVNDSRGLECPAGAHTRLANPRDVDTAGAMILRRGITYGSADADELGLIFLCYQADIEKQYEEIQGRFANAGYDKAPPRSRFPDALISQRGRDGSTVEIPHPSGRGSTGMRLNNTWVVPHGGLYLFVPSLTGLRELCG